jgi:WD40 repeat protein
VGEQLEQGNVDAALLLAVEAGRTAETVEAFTALRQAINHPRFLLLTLSGHTDDINSAVWNADESRILTTSDDGTVRQYYTRLEDVIGVACERVSRNLTRAEWQQFMNNQPYRATCPDLPVPEE